MGKQSKANSQGGRTAREQAAAAREAAQAAEKRRQRTINIAIAVVITLVVGSIIGGALYVSNQTKEESGAVADPSAPRPQGAFGPDEALAYGIPYGSNPEATTVEVWEDFQCPACQQFEGAAGADLRQRADNGEIVLVTRVTTFLDRSLSTDHSRRAAAAFGCSVDAGIGMDYKSAVFAGQPEREGDGWTDDQLVGFAASTGLDGDALTTFETCFTDRVYLPWATNSTEKFYDVGEAYANEWGTPAVFVDGTKVETSDVLDPATFQGLLDAAAAAE